MSRPSSSEYVYLQPYGAPRKNCVPIGAVACVNSSDVRFSGYYSHEICAETLSSCKLLATSLHWAHSVPSFVEQIKFIKKSFPEITIAVGGISAVLMRGYIFRETEIDYIFSGHSERAFAEVVRRIRDGETIDDGAPGVLTRDNWKTSGPATESDFANTILDAWTLDWFPSLREHTLERHENVRRNEYMHFSSEFPYVQTMRGCGTGCAGCYGSYGDILFPNQEILKSTSAILESIRRVESVEEYSFLNFTGDFITRMGPARARAALPSLSRLFCSYHFCGVPDPEDVKLLTDTFARVCVFIILRRKDFNRNNIEFDAHWKKLGAFLAWSRNVSKLDVHLHVFSAWMIHKCLDLKRIYPGVFVKDNREWLIKKPSISTYRENIKLHKSEEIAALYNKFQRSLFAGRLLESEISFYFDPTLLPSEGNDRSMPGMSRPPARISAVEQVPGLEKGERGFYPVKELKTIGNRADMVLVYELNAPHLEGRLKAAKGSNIEYLAVEFNDEELRFNLWDGLVSSTSAIRLSRPCGVDGDEEIIIYLRFSEKETSIRAISGDETLFYLETRHVFRLFESIQPGLRFGDVMPPKDVVLNFWGETIHSGCFCAIPAAALEWNRNDFSRKISGLKSMGAGRIILVCPALSMNRFFQPAARLIKKAGLELGLITDVSALADPRDADKYLRLAPAVTFIQTPFGKLGWGDEAEVEDTVEKLSRALTNISSASKNVYVSACVSVMSPESLKRLLSALFCLKLPFNVVLNLQHGSGDYFAGREAWAIEPISACAAIMNILMSGDWPVDTSDAALHVGIKGVTPCMFPPLAELMKNNPSRKFYQAPQSGEGFLVSWEPQDNIFVGCCSACAAADFCQGFPTSYVKAFPGVVSLARKFTASGVESSEK